MPDEGDRHLAATAAALLDQGQDLGKLSRALLVLSFGALLVPLALPVARGALGCLALSALAGLAGTYLGARVAFDAALFRGLAAGQGTLASLDDALAGLGLLPPGKAGRKLAPRVAGARRLLLRQVALLALQAGTLATAAALAAFGH